MSRARQTFIVVRDTRGPRQFLTAGDSAHHNQFIWVDDAQQATLFADQGKADLEASWAGDGRVIPGGPRP